MPSTLFAYDALGGVCWSLAARLLAPRLRPMFAGLFGGTPAEWPMKASWYDAGELGGTVWCFFTALKGCMCFCLFAGDACGNSGYETLEGAAIVQQRIVASEKGYDQTRGHVLLVGRCMC